jgi:hypothetical protein
MNFSPAIVGGFGFLTFITFILGLAITILWIVIAWRAMRAHENLAQSHQDLHQELRKIALSLSTQEDKPQSWRSREIESVDPSKLPRFKE